MLLTVGWLGGQGSLLVEARPLENCPAEVPQELTYPSIALPNRLLIWLNCVRWKP